MKSIYTLLVGVILILSACNPKPNSSKPEAETVLKVENPFFGVIPSDTPKLLVPDFLASPATEYNGTFSPDGKEFYYTTDIPENAFVTFTALQSDNTWSEPRVASFSGGLYSDYDPLFSPDGSRLYFSSSRPKLDNQDSKIWYVDRTETGWGKPKSIVFTSSENREYYSSLTHKGDIYFNSRGNIYKAKRVDTTYEVEILPEAINTNQSSVDPFIDPDEKYIIFRDYRRSDSYGRGDLYISFNIDGQWTSSENLGEPINSAGNEMCPYVTTDGKLFIFSSSRVSDKVNTQPLDPIQKVHKKFDSYNNGEGNIYYVSTDFIGKMREKHLNKKNQTIIRQKNTI